jgi:hypothetical protein
MPLKLHEPWTSDPQNKWLEVELEALKINLIKHAKLFHLKIN